MAGSSIMPPKKRLIVEFQKHAREYDWLNSKGHMDDYATNEESQRFVWHREEMKKLKTVLDALYPGWESIPLTMQIKPTPRASHYNGGSARK